MSTNIEVQAMFDRIAHRYDLFNTLATFGRDGSWRKRTAQLAAPIRVQHALDAATGTGKLAVQLLKRADEVTAFDFSDQMLSLANQLHRRHIDSGHLRFISADAERLPFGDETFDCATIGFGIRNLQNPATGLQEFFRVLKKGGRLVIMELSRPPGGISLLLYRAAFKTILPLMGRLLSGDGHAYHYLPESVNRFSTPKELVETMRSVGFSDVMFYSGHFSTVTFHIGIKPS